MSSTWSSEQTKVNPGSIVLCGIEIEPEDTRGTCSDGLDHC
ncbi:hypothetical protein SXANM310S_03756 [Streptomyces xanthochromogenes]